MRTEDVFVATTIRFYYDATIAVALATVFALVVSLIAAVIVGGNGPNASVAFVVFMLTGAILLLRWWRGWQGSGSRPFLMGPTDRSRHGGSHRWASWSEMLSEQSDEARTYL
jgi:hypothetical protein